MPTKDEMRDGINIYPEHDDDHLGAPEAQKARDEQAKAKFEEIKKRGVITHEEFEWLFNYRTKGLGAGPLFDRADLRLELQAADIDTKNTESTSAPKAATVTPAVTPLITVSPELIIKIKQFVDDTDNTLQEIINNRNNQEKLTQLKLQLKNQINELETGLKSWLQSTKPSASSWHVVVKVATRLKTLDKSLSNLSQKDLDLQKIQLFQQKRNNILTQAFQQLDLPIKSITEPASTSVTPSVFVAPAPVTPPPAAKGIWDKIKASFIAIWNGLKGLFIKSKKTTETAPGTAIPQSQGVPAGVPKSPDVSPIVSTPSPVISFTTGTTKQSVEPTEVKPTETVDTPRPKQ